MRERVSPRDVVHQESTGSSSVVTAGDALETFLAGGVPNLQLDVLLVDLDSASPKLDANRQVVLLAEPLVREL